MSVSTHRAQRKDVSTGMESHEATSPPPLQLRRADRDTPLSDVDVIAGILSDADPDFVRRMRVAIEAEAQNNPHLFGKRLRLVAGKGVTS